MMRIGSRSPPHSHSPVAPIYLLTMDDSKSFSTNFFAALEKRSNSDTSVRATLRRSLMFEPGTDARTFPLIEKRIGQRDESKRRIIYLVAGLWAQGSRQEKDKSMSQKQDKSVSFPEAMRRVCDKEKSDSIEKRFTALLDADADELRWRLRSAVTLAASQRIVLDWPGLLDDMLKWHYSNRPVQIRWARSFWEQPPEVAPA